MKRLDVGARVHEPTYGHGSVIAVENAFTRIQFDDNTVRKFLTSLARLEPSSEPAPVKRSRARARKSKATKSAAKKTAETAETTKTVKTTKKAKAAKKAKTAKTAKTTKTAKTAKAAKKK